MELNSERIHGLTDVCNTAAVTVCLACGADSAAVMDKVVAEIRRFFWRKNFTEFPFDFHRFFQSVHQSHAVAQTDAMGIDNDGRFAEKVTKDQIGSFSSYAGKSDQLFHRIRDFAVMPFQKCLCTQDDIFGLASEKAAGTNVFFHFCDISRSKIFQSRKACKQCRRYHVDACVGALCGKADRKE